MRKGSLVEYRGVTKILQSLVVDRTSEEELLVLRMIDSIIADGGIVPYELLRHSLAEQLNGAYENAVRGLIEKGFLEEVYAEGFDLGLRRIGS
jgi:hypothetical protein